MAQQRRVVVPSPENSETPIDEVQSWVTPNRLFFVRNHFDVPEIDLANWRLTISGLVERDVTLSWDDLESMPRRSVFSTVECAGNGRSFLQPAEKGVQWGAGAVGHAEWTGVPLRHVMQAAGLKPEAIELVFEGLDIGTEHDHPEPMHFARSLPVEKALHPETLLATRMNGELLEPIHGFPVRMLVPGWYGVASVKWLSKIEAVSTPYDGYFQTVKYVSRRVTGRGIETESVGPMPVKSEIIKPQENTELGVGVNRIFGMAWAGEDAVAEVEVSVDGGASWRRAEIIGLQAPYSWVLWEYMWDVSEGGEYCLLSRALSEGGQLQPTRHDPHFGGYKITFSRPTHVRVNPDHESLDYPADRTQLAGAFEEAAEERSKMRLDVEMDLIHGSGI